MALPPTPEGVGFRAVNAMKQNSPKDIATNKRAFFDYEILDTLEVGLVLTGTEVKSLRNHGGNIQEGYIKILGGEAWLVGASIAPYTFGNLYNHEERRDRKLLLHKRELLKLKEQTKEKGLSVVPISLYFKKGVVKLKIGVGRGKKVRDKRSTLIEKEKKREVDRAMKGER